MTAEELFGALFNQYGEDFNWRMLPLSQADGAFVQELKKELGQGHFLYHQEIRAVAKCDSNDDVLYVTKDEMGVDTYYIFHLTYAEQNAEGYPKYKEFSNLSAVTEYIGQAFILEYL